LPRDLPIGNGNMLVAFDRLYRLREFYYPYVGQANHTQGKVFRFGVWVDGTLSWIEEDSWQRQLLYETDTLVTEVRLVNTDLGIALTCRDCVDFDLDLYLRRIDLENLREEKRDVRLFFHHDFEIGGNPDGDTAYYHPGERALIHYKGQNWFLVNGMTQRVWGLSSYATGITRHHGSEGTWRDAEDGNLGRNAISQGSVDSTAAIHVPLERTATAYYWIGAARDLTGVLELNQHVRELEPDMILRRVRAYWRQWVSHDHPHPGLPDELRTFYRRSLLILRTQIDNRGSILAANDSDTLQYNRDSYSYLWPRDGALVAHALDLAGYHDVSERFFSFCAKLLTPGGFFMHKYNPDGSVGSSWHPWVGESGLLQLPIQEDETALTLYALWEHYALYRDIDFIRTIYAPFIERAGDFLWGYRETRTQLPDASWDLWEERRGIHLFTVASVWAGLQAASNFAAIFGDDVRVERYRRAAAEIKKATEEHLFDHEQGRFIRGIFLRNRFWEQDDVLDSSQCGIFLFGMFAADDPRVVCTVKALEESLRCRTEVGGIARYENDTYYQITQDTEQVPGNPWFLCSLWLAQWQIACSTTSDDLSRPLKLLQWVADHSSPSGVLAEQVHPYTGEPLSVSPLTWSHATFVTTVCLWERKHRQLTDRRRSTK
jgi:oligosaccharide amylase